MDETRIPVIVGVGQINDRANEDQVGLNSLELMQAALRIADSDGGSGWLPQIDSLAVVAQLSFPELGDVSKPLAEAIGCTPTYCAQTRYPMGDSPVMLLDEAANRIAAGESSVVAVVGGEALRTAAHRARANAIDTVRDAAARAAKPLRQRYGIVAPTDIYPLYENACRAAWGQTLAQAQMESAEIWSHFSRIAADNPHAWLRKRLTAEEILTPSPDNRPIAFPYTKLMVANSSVNQGAGFIVTSVAKAKTMGVSEARLVYIGCGASAREPGDVLLRDRFDHSASMEATLRGALVSNGLKSTDLDAVELYSCFPCVPKLARRSIDWPIDKPMTVSGGLTFGGGPIGNYMSHAIATMTEVLRSGGTNGMLFGNGGYATTSHALVLSRDAAVSRASPHNADVQRQADANRGVAPRFLENYLGPGVVETYTVFYERSGAPKFGVIIALTPNGERALAHVAANDTHTLAFLSSGDNEPVGSSGDLVVGGDELMIWRPR